MGLKVSYISTIMNDVEREMRKKIMTCWFFILYNNTNFHEYMHNTAIFNQEV